MPASESVYDMISPSTHPLSLKKKVCHCYSSEENIIKAADRLSDDTDEMRSIQMTCVRDNERESDIIPTNQIYRANNPVYNLEARTEIYSVISDDNQSNDCDFATNPIYNSGSGKEQIYSVIFCGSETETDSTATNLVYGSIYDASISDSDSNAQHKIQTRYEEDTENSSLSENENEVSPDYEKATSTAVGEKDGMI